MNRQKGSVILIIPILILVAVGLFLYVKKELRPPLAGNITPVITDAPNPSSTPEGSLTSNWKIYRNEKYGFEFKYPNYLSDNCCSFYSDSLYGMDKIITFAEKLDTNFDEGAEVYNGISFLVSSRNSNETLRGYVENQKIKNLETFYKDPETLELNLFNEKIIETTINGVKSLKIPHFSVLGTDTYYLQTKDGKYFIAIIQSEEHTSEFEQTFNQILSTFKFIDENESGKELGETDTWYKIKVSKRLNTSDPEYNSYAYLREPIRKTLGLPNYKSIKKIVVDTTVDKWGVINFDASYFILVSDTILKEGQYKDGSLFIDLEILNNNALIPYLEDNKFCKQNSDCIIRNAYYCSYGSYNHYESIEDHVSGCEGSTYDSELKQTVDTLCNKLTYENPQCKDNKCIASKRTYDKIPCN